MINRQLSLNVPAHIFWTTNSVIDSIIGASLKYIDLNLGPQAKKWILSCPNKLGQLAQGIKPRILTGSNTIHFIHPL